MRFAHIPGVIFITAYIAQGTYLPRAKLRGVRLSDSAPLQASRGFRDLDDFDNFPLRKHNHHRQERAKGREIYDDHRHGRELYDDHRQKRALKGRAYDEHRHRAKSSRVKHGHQRRRQVKRSRDMYEVLFNDNGMMYLTPPRRDDERELNGLLNEIVHLTAELKQGQLLKKF